MNRFRSESWSSRGRAVALVLVASSAITAGCVPNRLYHERPAQYLQRVADRGDGGMVADLAVIEFDDQGILWEREQLEDALRGIRAANQEARAGTIVTVYIHGWKHNADASREKGAFARFRETIRRDATRDPSEHPFAADRIVGVFLGWRGDTSDVPIQENLTFWDRRQAGERVASIQMQETLLRIMRATKEHPGSKCFIVGHSMGGMIIGKSMAPTLTTLLLAGESHEARLPVDLVILQNPAIEALASWELIDLLKRFRATLELRASDGTITPAAGPLIASITSEADTATGVAYPIGRGVASLGTSFRTDHPQGEPSQQQLATQALGHVDYLTSHRAFVRDGELVLERVPDAWNDTPFWVIRVSREISKDHGDVNSPLFRQLVARLLQLNEVYRTDLASWIVVSEPDEPRQPM